MPYRPDGKPLASWKMMAAYYRVRDEITGRLTRESGTTSTNTGCLVRVSSSFNTYRLLIYSKFLIYSDSELSLPSIRQVFQPVPVLMHFLQLLFRLLCHVWIFLAQLAVDTFHFLHSSETKQTGRPIMIYCGRYTMHIIRHANKQKSCRQSATQHVL